MDTDTERLRVQLAGCLTAAEGGIGEGMVANEDDYGWSLAYQRTLELRRRYETQRAALVDIMAYAKVKGDDALHDTAHAALGTAALDAAGSGKEKP